MNDHDHLGFRVWTQYLEHQREQVFVQAMAQDTLLRVMELIMRTATPKPERRKQDWSPRES